MNTNPCSTCGTPLPTDAPGGLCPNCLAQTVLSPGDRLRYFGNYELAEEVGRGGMGVVWRARQTALNRTVAIKMIPGGVLAHADDVRRFQAEAEAAANLQHPNIVAIHEIGEHEGQHYYSMDFVEGKNLAEWCHGKPLPARRAAELIATIADAVQYAHQRGILHRDLKPQNVMIDENGTPRLTDFGLAKRIDQDSGLTQTGAVLGSPSYMAPEQAQGRADLVAPHTDVHALGAILYEMLTGQAPFRAGSPAETMMRVISENPTPPAKLNADVPKDLETICLKCLEKDPARRYATARDFAEDVRRFLASEPIVARPASTLRKVESWLRRHPSLIGGFSGLLIFALIFLVVYLAEQNAFLRAQQINPELVRVPGERLKSLLLWEGIGGIVLFNAAVWTALWRKKHACRLEWKDFWNRGQDWRAQYPVPPHVLTICTFIWLAILCFGITFFVKLIQTQVWEGGIRFSHVFMPVILPFVSGALLLGLWQDHRRRVEGTHCRNLRPDDATAIRAAVESFELPLAIRLYRKVVPEATLAEARDHVLRMAEEFREAQPEKYAALAIRPWWEVNARAMVLCGVIEGAAIAAWCLKFPPVQPFPFGWGLATGFVFGALAMLSSRVKGFGKRFLLVLIPMLAMLFGGEFMRDSRGERESGAFVCGTMLGVLFMVSAYTRSRR